MKALFWLLCVCGFLFVQGALPGSACAFEKTYEFDDFNLKVKGNNTLVSNTVDGPALSMLFAVYEKGAELPSKQAFYRFSYLENVYRLEELEIKSTLLGSKMVSIDIDPQARFEFGIVEPGFPGHTMNVQVLPDSLQSQPAEQWSLLTKVWYFSFNIRIEDVWTDKVIKTTHYDDSLSVKLDCKKVSGCVDLYEKYREELASAGSEAVKQDVRHHYHIFVAQDE